MSMGNNMMFINNRHVINKLKNNKHDKNQVCKTSIFYWPKIFCD